MKLFQVKEFSSKDAGSDSVPSPGRDASNDLASEQQPGASAIADVKNLNVRASITSMLYGCAVLVLLYPLAFGQSSWWSSSGAKFLSVSQAILCAVMIAGCGAIYSKGSLGALKIKPIFIVLCACIGLLMWFCFDSVTRTYSWFSSAQVRGEIMLAGCVALVLLKRSARATVTALFIAALALPAAAFFYHLDGRLLISDDHASFFYRLSLLQMHFPNIPFYNTDWNGGYDARDFFATGALNVYPIFVAFTQFFTNELAYNATAAWITFGLPALGVFWATRIVTRSFNAACFAGVLATSASLIWYRWSLVYGTLGFCTSTALFPVVMALTWRALVEPQALARKRDVLIFIGVWTLFLLWPGSVFMLPPVAVLFLIYLRSALLKRPLLIACLVIGCINLPWMLLFSKVSQVTSFVAVSKPSAEAESGAIAQKRANLGARAVRGEVSFARTLKSFREQVASANPLIPLLLIPGIVLLPRRNGLFILATVSYLFVLGTAIAPVKPHLELERMALTGMLLASIPAGVALSWLLEVLSVNRGHPRASVRAGLLLLSVVPLGMLFSSPFVAASVSTNRSILRFYLAEKDWNEVLETFRSFGKEQGRILFSGFLLHELDGGHAAPLPQLSGVPAVASSQFHNLWAYRQVFPKSYLERGDPGIKEYLDTLNIGGIFAHERQWRDYFSSRPAEYRLERMIGRFSFFRRLNHVSSYLHSGAVEKIQIDQHRIVLTPITASVVLRFNHLDFLESSGCVMKGERVSSEINLIRLDECIPGKKITVQSISPLKRLLM